MKKFLKENKKTIIICLFLLGLTFFVNLKVCKDPDYYWHIKAGEYMINHGQFLTKDIFSWVTGIYNTYWVSHEWLFDVMIFILSRLFPGYHVLIYSIICIFSLLCLIFFLNKKKWLSNILFTLVWNILGMFFLVTYTTPRPQLLVFLFLVVTLYLLYDLRSNEKSNKIYLLPVLTIIWSNIHGGSSNMPYILTFIFIVIGLFNFKCSKMEASRLSKVQFKKYILVFFLCLVATMINPHGIRMLIYPYENMSNQFMLKTITEWHPTNLNEIYHCLFFFLFSITLLIVLLSKKKLQFIDLVIFGFTLFLGLKSIRFWMFFYIAASMIIVNYIPEYKLKKGDENYILLIVVLLFGFFMMGFKDINKSLEKKVLSDKVISYLKENKPKRLYNYYDYGGYLIYNDIKVFVDGRADLYSKYNYEDSYNLSTMTGNIKKIIDKYDFDYYLISKDSSLSYYLKEREDFRLVLQDGKQVIYKKV